MLTVYIDLLDSIINIWAEHFCEDAEKLLEKHEEVIKKHITSISESDLPLTESVLIYLVAVGAVLNIAKNVASREGQA